MKFNDREIELNNEGILGDWKCMKNQLDKTCKIKEEERKNQLKVKNQQGQVWSKFEKEDHIWLQSNINWYKASRIVKMQEQMVETRSWKDARALTQNKNC